MKKWIVAALGALVFWSCATEPVAPVLATTSIVADAARELLPESIEVAALMSSNIDPHSYKPVESDVAKLAQSIIILHNGLHLEGKMTDILEKLAAQKPVFAMSDALDPAALIEAGPGVYDPHIWFDLDLWATSVEGLSAFLQEVYPEHAQEIGANEVRYTAALREASANFKRALADIPDSTQAMVTAHDAFSYFGRAYGIQVRGLQGISTAAEFGIKDVSQTATFIMERGLSTVFAETSVNPKSIQALQEAVQQMGGEVRIGEALFSDALGEQGTPEASLIGAFQHNTNELLKSFR